MALTVYTPEVFPTSVRGTAMGYCSSAARIGAIITPFVAQVCTSHYIHVNILVIAYTIFKTALLTVGLPGVSEANVF